MPTNPNTSCPLRRDRAGKRDRTAPDPLPPGSGPCGCGEMTMLASHDLTGASASPNRHSSSESHAVLIAEIASLRAQNAALVEALQTTLANLDSLRSAASGVRVYDKWRDMVADVLRGSGVVP